MHLYNFQYQKHIKPLNTTVSNNFCLLIQMMQQKNAEIWHNSIFLAFNGIKLSGYKQSTVKWLYQHPTKSTNVGSRALSFSGPLLSVGVDVCGSVCLSVRNFEVKYLENQRC